MSAGTVVVVVLLYLVRKNSRVGHWLVQEGMEYERCREYSEKGKGFKGQGELFFPFVHVGVRVAQGVYIIMTWLASVKGAGWEVKKKGVD